MKKVKPLHLQKSYYENPYRVMWIIAITRVNMPNPWIGNLMRDLYNLLALLSKTTREKTEKIKTSIGAT